MLELKGHVFKKVLDNIYDGVYIVDSDRRIVYWNKGTERITGFKGPEVLGKQCRGNVLVHVDNHGTSLCSSDKCPAQFVINGGDERIEEVFLSHKEGYRLPVLTRISSLVDENGKIIGAIEIFTDNREVYENRAKIETLGKLAVLDGLTEIGNRKYARSQIQSLLSSMERYGWKSGILFIDVDFFKKVNDTYGHNAGDQVLEMLAHTLSNGLRGSDMVCRWGGEEFIALIANADEQTTLSIAERVRCLVEKSNVVYETNKIFVTLSVGVTLTSSGDTLETVVQRADNLMYMSKESGRNRTTTDFGN